MAPIGWVKSVPAAILTLKSPLARLAPPRAARTAHHGQVERLNRPIRALRSAQRPLGAPFAGSCTWRARRVPFTKKRLLADSPPPSAPIICARHVYRGGIIREYASRPSVPRGRTSSQRLCLAASPKGLFSGLDCHLVLCCFSVPVLAACACRRPPVPGSQEAPTREFPRSWSLYCRSTI